MKCEKCSSERFDTHAMRLVMGQEGAHEQTIAVHECKDCGHKWKGELR